MSSDTRPGARHFVMLCGLVPASLTVVELRAFKRWLWSTSAAGVWSACRDSYLKQDRARTIESERFSATDREVLDQRERKLIELASEWLKSCCPSDGLAAGEALVPLSEAQRELLLLALEGKKIDAGSVAALAEKLS